MVLSGEGVMARRRLRLHPGGVVAGAAIAALVGGLLVAGVGHERARDHALQRALELHRDHQLQRDLAAERARTYPRPPLAEPAIPGDAMATYLQAMEAAAAIDLYAAVGPEGSPWRMTESAATWADAPAPLRALAAGDAAAEVSALLARGASQPFHRPRLAPDDDIFADMFSAAQPTTVVKARALELSARGHAAEAARDLLALLRYGQDLGRGSLLFEYMFGAAGIRGAAQLLPAIAAAGDLSALELRDLLRTYERLLATQPSFADSLRLESLWMRTHVSSALVFTAASERAYRAALETAGRPTEVRADAVAAAWGDLEDGEGFSRFLVRSDRTDSLVRASYLALALLVHHREHDAYPAALDALVPDIIPALPNDPVSTLPFHYEHLAEGGVLLRGGTARDRPAAEIRLP
jgi:hypothetical protein